MTVHLENPLGPKTTGVGLERGDDLVPAVLDVAVALIVVYDREGGIVGFSRSCEEATGYSYEEVSGLPLWGLLLAPEEVEAVKAEFGSLKQGETSSQITNYWVTKDGSRLLINWRYGPGGLDWVCAAWLALASTTSNKGRRPAPIAERTRYQVCA
jgi:PAS domain S-box-containing protein